MVSQDFEVVIFEVIIRSLEVRAPPLFRVFWHMYAENPRKSRVSMLQNAIKLCQ